MLRPPTRIFISYRRDDEPVWAHLVRVHLLRRIPDLDVYLDVASNQVGDRFDRKLYAKLDQADILIAIIGRRWARPLASKEPASLLADPKDWVRSELEIAIGNETDTFPLLVSGAPFPQHDVPAELDELLYRQRTDLNLDDWENKLEPLVQRLSLAEKFADGLTEAIANKEWQRARDFKRQLGEEVASHHHLRWADDEIAAAEKLADQMYHQAEGLARVGGPEARKAIEALRDADPNHPELEALAVRVAEVDLAREQPKPSV